MRLLVADRIASNLNSLRTDPPHAVLLVGKRGVGLRTIANNICSDAALEIIPAHLTKASTTKQIGIEKVRELYDLTRSRSKAKQFVIIDDIDLMTIPAQNAFLKLLEEPNPNVHFVLTSHHPDRLLSTIRSRVQTFTIPPLNAQEVMPLASTLEQSKQHQIQFIAAGLPAEIIRLTDDEVYFQTAVAQTTLAKQLIEATPYDSIKLILNLPQTRSEVLSLIERLIHLLEFRPTAASTSRIGRLIDAYDACLKGANPRIQLAMSML